jgi:hypothetical protein
MPRGNRFNKPQVADLGHTQNCTPKPTSEMSCPEPEGLLVVDFEAGRHRLHALHGPCE